MWRKGEVTQILDATRGRSPIWGCQLKCHWLIYLLKTLGALMYWTLRCCWDDRNEKVTPCPTEPQGRAGEGTTGDSNSKGKKWPNLHASNEMRIKRMWRYHSIPSKTSKIFLCTKPHTGRTGSGEREDGKTLLEEYHYWALWSFCLPQKQPGKI